MKMNYKNTKGFKVKLFLITQLLILNSCKKMLDVDLPGDKITQMTVYSNTNTAASVMSGIYSKMSNSYYVSPAMQLAFVADEFKDINFFTPIYVNAVPRDDSDYGLCWQGAYKTIYACNSLIDGVTSSSAIVEKDKKLLIGEAKFTRAFQYFYLVNTYGGVPLAISPDFKVNSKLPRSTEDDVYQFIEKDLLEAKDDLSSNYLDPQLTSVTPERVRPTKWAAIALLARMYLYRNQWQKAENMSTEIIQNSSLFEIVSLDLVFKKNSKETIWALQPVSSQAPGENTNTLEGLLYNTTFGQVPGQSTISDNLLSAFEPGDQRKNKWLELITDNSVTPAKEHFHPFKYQIGGNITQNPQSQEEYSIVFRLAEQYLIRAEAKAHLSDLDGAKSDLSVVRKRAGLDDVIVSTQENMLNRILNERQTELFTEGGHRWFDLKRVGKIDEVMTVQSPIKGGTWSPYKSLFPLPYSDMTLNPSLQGHQNPSWPERL